MFWSRGRLGLLAVLIPALVTGVAFYNGKQEHPGEHPGKKVQEHPGEHPGKKTKEVDVKKIVEDAVSDYVESDFKIKGMFMVFDPKEKDVWMLKKELYHPIRQIDDKHYFLCANYNGNRVKNSAAHQLDIDFFLTKKSDTMTVDRVVVHKLDGVEYPKGASCSMHKDVQMFDVASGPCPACGMGLKENKK